MTGKCAGMRSGPADAVRADRTVLGAASLPRVASPPRENVGRGAHPAPLEAVGRGRDPVEAGGKDDGEAVERGGACLRRRACSAQASERKAAFLRRRFSKDPCRRLSVSRRAGGDRRDPLPDGCRSGLGALASAGDREARLLLGAQAVTVACGAEPPISFGAGPTRFPASLPGFAVRSFRRHALRPRGFAPSRRRVSMRPRHARGESRERQSPAEARTGRPVACA